MEFAAMFAHDAQNDGQTKTGADAGRLGSEKGIKDARLNGLGNTRTVVADFQQHALFGDAPGLHADNAASALRFDGMARIANQVHQDLLELPGIAVDEREHWVAIEFHANILGCGVEALKFESASDHLIERHATPLGTRVPGGEQKLAQDGAGALRFLENLARLVRAAQRIAAQKEALRITEDAGERVAEFVSDAGDHLAEFGKLFGLQQLGLKDALRGQVAVDLHVTEKYAFFIKDRTSSTLQQARNRAYKVEFFAHPAVGAAIQAMPVVCEIAGIGGGPPHRGKKGIERFCC